ncbi:MAG TPA: ABC transporter ATP-binding protein, partial [Spirochaetota bacterium]|nr:ABC transporter ATP-binding protein [Spirochaetota bacterium]
MIPLLSLNHIKSGYNNLPVIEDISLHIDGGEMWGIIGPNGAGKTTLIKTISGLLKPLQGSVKINNRELKKINHRQRAQKIAVVKQSMTPAFITVYDYLMLGRHPYFKNFQFRESKQDRDTVKQYLKLTNIEKYAGHYINQLSGGELQLAQIARAFIQQPELLLLDEPTAHLDITHQIKILDLLLKQNRENGLTVIMIQHDL